MSSSGMDNAALAHNELSIRSTKHRRQASCPAVGNGTSYTDSYVADKVEQPMLHGLQVEHVEIIPGSMVPHDANTGTLAERNHRPLGLERAHFLS